MPAGVHSIVFPALSSGQEVSLSLYVTAVQLKDVYRTQP